MVQADGIKRYLLLGLLLFSRLFSVYAEDPSSVVNPAAGALVSLMYYVVFVFENIIGDSWLTAWAVIIMVLVVMHYMRVTDSAVLVSVLILAFLTVYAIGWAQGTLAFIIVIVLFFVMFNWLTGIKG